MNKLNRTTARATQYPDKIIQFGEGNFLRAFVDWIIWKTNQSTDFNAGVTVVQPIANGKAELLNSQDGLYHLNLQGIDSGTKVDSIELIDVINKVINPYSEFDEYIRLAENPDYRFVISNTTEAGIAFDASCRLEDRPASSYPGKLTQLLYRRFIYFNGDKSKGLVILPCELIFNNGKELKKCIRKYIDLWKLGEDFREWFETACGVYCTLVDRIVPGYPKDNIGELLERIGYEDAMVDKAEVFHLWVIEAPESVAEEFPAAKAGLNVLFVPDESPYHDRKVTLLNGPHTVLSPVGYLSGLDTVKECVEDPLVGKFIRKVMFEELLGTLDLPEEDLKKFADDVLERFVNPYVRHFVTSIMLNSFPKYKTRDLPGLKIYLKRNGRLPECLVLGLAAITTYYKGGKRGKNEIAPADDPKTISLLQELWATGCPVTVARGVLGYKELWEEDLNMIPGLTDRLTGYLETIQSKGMKTAIEIAINR